MMKTQCAGQPQSTKRIDHLQSLHYQSQKHLLIFSTVGIRLKPAGFVITRWLGHV